MTSLTLGFGLLALVGVGSFFGLILWLIQQGKKIKEAEYGKERVILLEKHQKSINRWVKDVDRLVEEEKKLKEQVRSNPSLGNVVDVLRRAHGSDDLPPSEGSDAA